MGLLDRNYLLSKEREKLDVARATGYFDLSDPQLNLVRHEEEDSWYRDRFRELLDLVGPAGSVRRMEASADFSRSFDYYGGWQQALSLFRAYILKAPYSVDRASAMGIPLVWKPGPELAAALDHRRLVARRLADARQALIDAVVEHAERSGGVPSPGQAKREALALWTGDLSEGGLNHFAQLLTERKLLGPEYIPGRQFGQLISKILRGEIARPRPNPADERLLLVPGRHGVPAA